MHDLFEIEDQLMLGVVVAIELRLDELVEFEYNCF